jgi:hypothetical protein
VSRPAGNTKLKAARQHAGYASQQALVDALARAGNELGMRGVEVSLRQVRRWESPQPPWPHATHQRLLEHTLGQTMEQLGFTPPWGTGEAQSVPSRVPAQHNSGATPRPLPSPAAATKPASIGGDYAAITRAFRRLYWNVQPSAMRAAVAEHAEFGTRLLGELGGLTRRRVAAALAESLLLVGRIEFFDLRQPVDADARFVEALQAAGEADDSLLGAAILAHSAFVPGWAGDHDGASERLRAARAYARRSGVAPALFNAWISAVEAECETRSGKTREALRLISSAEDILANEDSAESPQWFDWFSPTRLAAFKGNVQLKSNHLPQARETLMGVLDELPEDAGKQRTVVLGDLAAVEAAAGDPRAACVWANEALDQLAVTWYATGMERIKEVRKALDKWADEECVVDLDDRLYQWRTTLTALQH